MPEILKIKSKIKHLIGQEVVESRAGGSAGSILYVIVDDKSYIAIWCAWRIEKDTEVIVTSSDTTEVPHGLVQNKTPILNDNKILDIKISAQYDLIITFENDYILRVFCDVGHSRNDYYENWELGIPSENLVIEINNHYMELISSYDSESE
ncbi:hypothetical protein [Lactococcus cremoris]|uniref:hypothetical protein n=1 Tax=Lactococcus lactis subsp. cremoris TaxID=1359 RepID=UPI0003AB7DCE|nr:hypothetical protein [Lactococcus cremoris]AGV72432.1 hypothetical protein kw2_0451 [Lactococcus cremoris subsp. cremoris KW2]